MPHLITPTFTGRSTLGMLLSGLVLPGTKARSGMNDPNETRLPEAPPPEPPKPPMSDAKKLLVILGFGMLGLVVSAFLFVGFIIATCKLR